jgi:hypothetical protein
VYTSQLLMTPVSLNVYIPDLGGLRHPQSFVPGQEG